MIRQGSPEWKDEKLGAITGTRAHDLISSNVTRRTLMALLIRELVTANTKEFFKQSLQEKLEIEPEAASYYSLMNNVIVTHQDAYIVSEISPMLAVSPDGLVGDDGGFECKRLDDENHIKMLLGMDPEKKYVHQCHWNMYITGRQWWDLFYYCETLPESMRSLTIRIDRDQDMMVKMHMHAEAMIGDVKTFLTAHGLGGLL